MMSRRRSMSPPALREHPAAPTAPPPWGAALPSREACYHRHVLKDPYQRKIDYLRLSVTDRCNLRCLYCMPAEGVPHLPHEDILTYEEILRFAAAAARSGIGKIRLTGGEPLVRKGIESLISGLSAISPRPDLSLTTNGILLDRQARALRRAGLRRVNVSIDSLDPGTYREITRGGDLEDALRGIRAALSAGLRPVKVNVVLLRGVNDSEKEISSFIRLGERLPVFIRFIEYMSPRGDLDHSHFVPVERVREVLEGLDRIEECDGPEGAGPASYLRLARRGLQVGLITPVTSHFCATCNRLRLTADGKLKSCLLSPTEMDIRALLREEAGETELVEAIGRCLADKPVRGELPASGILGNMSSIGG